MTSTISVVPTAPPTMAVRWTVTSERGTETLATVDLNPADGYGHRADVVGVGRRSDGQIVPAYIVGETTRHPRHPPRLPRLPADFFPMAIVTVLRASAVIHPAMIQPWGLS